MSRPRAATSVATSTRLAPALKRPSAWSLSRWSLSPWMMTLFSVRNATDSHMRLVFTKMMAWSLFASRKMQSRRSSFSRKSQQQTTRCSTSGFTRSASTSPTRTSTASRMNSAASRRTEAGHVAVNITVCRSCGSSLITFRICGSNPMSSIRSASSRTRKFTPSMLITPRSRKSSRRPGVQMAISQPSAMDCNWGIASAPPYIEQTRQAERKQRRLASKVICWHSSRVGARITHRGFTAPWTSSRAPLRIAPVMRGTKKAAVFPLPVWALTMTSVPEAAADMACFCTGVGTL
mmetsp:Transcript_66725/g.201420  ORF Transcript_66725/g.201420 Transcript_66725/m.201420 type:complete len:292 (+) Transcript_66725:841-1716(+)